MKQNNLLEQFKDLDSESCEHSIRRLYLDVETPMLKSPRMSQSASHNICQDLDGNNFEALSVYSANENQLHSILC